jgi:hypothetical protein
LLLTVPIAKTHILNAAAHTEHKRGGAKDIQAHPSVPSVQGGHGIRGLPQVRGGGGLAAAAAGVGQDGLDVGPGRDDGAEDDEAKGQQHERGHAPAEPQDLAVGDDDDGQVLEDGEDGHREELQGLVARVDLAHEQDRDGEPWFIDLVLNIIQTILRVTHISWPCRHQKGRDP